MSMISAQIDELRNAARGQKVMGLFELAQMLNDAADTIWQLRDDLQRANAAVQDAEHDESMAWDRVRKAEAENAKLREEFDKMDVWHSKELTAAMAENAKLRESVKRLMTQRDERLARAETDNAKLRECLQDLAEHIRENDGFGLDYGWMLDRMCELGVDA